MRRTSPRINLALTTRARTQSLTLTGPEDFYEITAFLQLEKDQQAEKILSMLPKEKVSQLHAALPQAIEDQKRRHSSSERISFCDWRLEFEKLRRTFAQEVENVAMAKFQKWRDADADLRDAEERERREAERRRVELMERRHEEEIGAMRGEYVETIETLRAEIRHLKAELAPKHQLRKRLEEEIIALKREVVRLEAANASVAIELRDLQYWRRVPRTGDGGSASRSKLKAISTQASLSANQEVPEVHTHDPNKSKSLALGLGVGSRPLAAPHRP